MGPITVALLLLAGLFGVLDTAAHLTRYRYGKTFSALIWWLENRYPLARYGVGGLCVVLFTHLVFQLP